MKTTYNNSVISSKPVNAGQGENVSMVIHDAEDDAPPSQRRSIAISQSLHKNPKFKSLFDQLGFGIQARIVATEALMKISTNMDHNATPTKQLQQGLFWKALTPSPSPTKIQKSLTL